MVSKLNASLDSLRSVVPALNAAADEANKIVKTVEHTLVNEIGVGVSVRGGCSREYCRRDVDDDGNATEEEVSEYLAFGRVHGVYSVCVETVTRRKDNYGQFNEEVDSEMTAWSSCDRETRLRTFAQIPQLIERIISEAKRLTDIGNSVAAQVKDLIADDDGTASDLAQASTQTKTHPIGLPEFAQGRVVRTRRSKA
jgi:hypothetical protein